MPQATWTPLANITLGSSASSVTFSNIPNTYRDLILIANWSLSASAAVLLRFNSDSGNNYSWVWMGGNGSTAFSEAGSGVNAGRLSTTTSASNVFTSYASIMDYSATDKHKTSIVRTGSAAVEALAIANRWANTAAVTTVAAVTSAGNFNSGSTFSLFGVIA